MYPLRYHVTHNCTIKSQTVYNFRCFRCLSTQLDTNLVISSSMVLLSALMIPCRKELTELSTEVPVVACDTKRDMNNYTDLADQ